MNVNKWHLKRMEWLLQKRLDESLNNLPIEVVAEELADGVILYVKTEILGEAKSAVVELDVPSGPWQALKACFGLRHKKRHLYISAYQLFPDLRMPKDQRTIVYAEGENVT
jgi:hypothetical protein